MQVNTKSQARRLLRHYQSSGKGNWRFKGLLAAAFATDPSVVGEVWPTSEKYLAEEYKAPSRRHLRIEDNYVVPGLRGEATAERALARSVYGKDDMNERVLRDQYISEMLTSGEGRALLRGSDAELDTLWREELINQVIEGASVKQIARDAATVIPVDAKVGDYPRGAADVYADPLSEGGRIETNMEDYDTVAYSCTKHGQGFAVTDEMVEHAQIDAIARQVEFAGTAIENAINRRWLNQLLDDAGNNVDTDQATPTYTEVQGLNHGVAEVEADDFPVPDVAVMHPEFKAAYFDEAQITQANYAGSDTAIRQRVFDPIFDMEILTGSSGTYNGTTYNWEWNSDADRGAVVSNSNFIGIFMYQDIATKDFDDPIRDLQGGNARAWFDVQLLQPNAHARLQY